MKQIKKLEEALTPYKFANKIRIGSNFDGGYILPKETVLKAECLLSFGVSTNIDFEKEMSTLNPNLAIKMYDPFIGPVEDFKRLAKRMFGKVEPVKRNIQLKKNEQYKAIKKGLLKESISRFFHWVKFYGLISKKNIHYQKIGLRNYDDSLFTSFDSIFKNSFLRSQKEVVIKMDIEGDEYKVYKDLLKYSSQISVVLLELHEVETYSEEVIKLIEQFRVNGLFLIHIHGNNSDVLVEGSTIPNTLELSFAKCTEQTTDDNLYPDKNLDAPCNPYWEDYKLSFLRKAKVGA
jgi:hypothetical protein